MNYYEILAKFETKHSDKVYSLSTHSLEPNHWSFTITFLFVHLLIVYLLCNCKHSLLSSIILWPHCISQLLQLWILYTLNSTTHKQTCCHAHKHMQFLYQYTASTTQVSGVESVPPTWVGGNWGSLLQAPSVRGPSNLFKYTLLSQTLSHPPEK